MNMHRLDSPITKIDTLGADQWKWLDKFRSIDLAHWRIEYIKEHGDFPQWFYVGKWKPSGLILPYDEDPDADGGYGERFRNLKRDRYFYWPT